MMEVIILLGMMFLLFIVLLVLTLVLNSKTRKDDSHFKTSGHDIGKIKKQITEEEEW